MEEQTTLDDSKYIKPTSDDWETPKELFDRLNKKYKFTLDPCCQESTAKCETYYTIEDDGLSKHLGGHRVFMNPPYSDITPWVKRAKEDWRQAERAELIVALLPAWTDREWFHDYVYNHARIEFLRGRVKFLKQGRPYKSPKFGCMLVEWR